MVVPDPHAADGVPTSVAPRLVGPAVEALAAAPVHRVSAVRGGQLLPARLLPVARAAENLTLGELREPHRLGSGPEFARVDQLGRRVDVVHLEILGAATATTGPVL